MPVTLTADKLAAALRVGSSNAETAEVTRLLAYSVAAIERHLGETAYGDAPDVILNEAAVRLAGYLYDLDTTRYPRNPIQRSGASAILLPYRIHRAGVIGTDGATGTGSGTGSGDVDLSGVNARIAAVEASLAVISQALAGIRQVPTGGTAKDVVARDDSGSGFSWRSITAVLGNLVDRLLPTGVTTGKYLRKTATGWEGADPPSGGVTDAQIEAAYEVAFDGPTISRNFVSGISTDENEALTSVDNTAKYGVTDFLAVDRDADAEFLDSIAAGDYLLLKVGAKRLVAKVAGANLATGSDSDVREIWYSTPVYSDGLDSFRQIGTGSGTITVGRPLIDHGTDLIAGDTSEHPDGSLARQNGEIRHWPIQDMRAHIVGVTVRGLALAGTYRLSGNLPSTAGKVYIASEVSGLRQVNITWASTADHDHLALYLARGLRFSVDDGSNPAIFEIETAVTKNTIANGGFQLQAALLSGDIPAAATDLTVSVLGDVAHLADIEDLLLPSGGVSGDVIYHDGNGWVRLVKGTDGQILKLASGAPSWADESGGGGSPTYTSLTSGTSLSGSAFTFSNTDANTLSQALIDRDHDVYLVQLRDQSFNEHGYSELLHVGAIVSYNRDMKWRFTSVKDDGTVIGCELRARRNNATAQATASIVALSGSFDSGTVARVYGVS